jgi:DHA1 family tetracycline resistance protein-like MFS transporter
MTDNPEITPMKISRIFPILLIVFTNLLGSGVIIPILPVFAVKQMGATVFQAALLGTTYFIAQFFAAPWLGRLSDRYGRRPILMISQIGTIIAFVLFTFAQQLGSVIDQMSHSLPMKGGLIILFAARFLDGLTGGNITTARAWISDVTDSQDRAAGMGYLSAAFASGFIFGAAFGGFLGSFGFMAPFIGAAAATLGTFLITFFMLEESLPQEQRTGSRLTKNSHFPLSQLLKIRPLLFIAATGFLGTLAYAAIPPTFALYVDQIVFAGIADRSHVPLYTGLMLSFMGLVAVLTQAVIYRRLIVRLRERLVLIIGMIVFMSSTAAIGWVTRPVFFIPVIACYAFALATTDPSLQALVTRFGNRNQQGVLIGLYQSVSSMATIAGPVWAGWIYEHVGPAATYKCGGAILLAGVCFAAMLLREQLPESEEGAENE